MSAVGPVEAGFRARYAEAHARLWKTASRPRIVALPPPRPPAPAPIAAPVSEPPPFAPDHVGRHWPKNETRRVICEVARKHGVGPMDLLRGGGRTLRIVVARQEAMYRLRKERQLSWYRVGKALGGFDHTTALWGYRRHEERLGMRK